MHHAQKHGNRCVQKMHDKENPGVLDLQKIDFNTYGRHKA